MLKLSVSNINKLFEEVSKLGDLYAPIEKATKVEFHKWDNNSNVRLDCLNTNKSAKDLFFPQSEDIVSFKMEGKNITIEAPDVETDEFVVFGVKACDVRSFDILDSVFLSDPVDSYYKAKREKMIIVSMACNEPEETCFCNVFGIDSSNPLGDVTTWIKDNELYWKANTQKGEALTEKVLYLFEDTDEKAVNELKEEIKAIMDKLPLANLNLEGIDGNHLKDLFYSDKWNELYKSCLGCGTCTFVCPTCQCYDIKDFKTNDGVQRFRCWDSCMYSDFTKMAHGNSRKSQLERFRQRFMHKLVYYPSNNNGVYGCVGCGRCLSKCPVSMNIVKVAKALGVDK